MKDQVKARFDSKPTVNFSDVSSGAWYYDAVQMCAKAGIVAGYPGGSFKPDQAVTRAEFFKMVAMLYSDTLNTPITGGIFKDINGHWRQRQRKTERQPDARRNGCRYEPHPRPRCE